MSRSKTITIVSGVAVAAVLAGFASYTATKPASPGTSAVAEVSAGPSEGVYPELEAYARRDASDGLALGRADAPVVLIEYADFKCGYCGKFARDTEPVLVEKYVRDGTLRIEWRNFPIFGEESEQAARAAWAAGQQNRFWEFHDQAYGTTHKRNSGAFAADKVTGMARAAGVKDLDRFRKDMASDEAAEAVRRDQEEGYSLGVSSTPAFLVNDVPVLGAQPVDTFRQAIEAAAEDAR